MTPRALLTRVLLAVLVLVILAISPADRKARLRTNEVQAEPLLKDMQRLKEQVNQTDHQALFSAKTTAIASGSPLAIAQANAPLSTEAQARAAVVMELWLTRLDPETGLMPTSIEPPLKQFVYGDTGADLLPHFGIAVNLLSPDRFGLILDMLNNERQLTTGVPETIDLDLNREISMDPDDAIFGAAEYVKDGLLPLMERLGPDPWLGRAREVVDTILATANVPTQKHGNVSANSTEVNGDMLQNLARLYWGTREPRYLEAADRMALTYLEDVLPKTTYLPPNQWNFMENEPIGRRRLRLSDHGNEVISGLVEWHVIESALQRPGVAIHRQAIRRMLDRILETGRNEDGMWLRVIEIPSGKVEQPGLTDSWGYVFQAFLAQAAIERQFPDGDVAVAERYEAAAQRALQALPKYRNYAWEGGQMDGYADALESDIYMLNVLVEPAAAEWLDDQIGVLFSFQRSDGTVLERDLDGNFIRTALLYSAWLTRGARLAPWSPDVDLGAAVDGDCTVFALSSSADWDGRLVFDTPRSRLNMQMPIDYPRLNKWPEWLVVESDKAYQVTGALGSGTALGSELAQGVALHLGQGESASLRVCPT